MRVGKKRRNKLITSKEIEMNTVEVNEDKPGLISRKCKHGVSMFEGKIDGMFPKWEGSVVPKYTNEDSVSIGLDPARMRLLLDGVVSVLGRETRECEMVVPKDKHKPIVITCGSTVKVTGVIMPLDKSE